MLALNFRSFILALVCSLWMHSEAIAATNLNIGVLVGGQYTQTDGDISEYGIALRGYASAHWGFSSYRIGPIVAAEFFGERGTEYLLGGSFRFGNTTFLEVGAGLYKGDEDVGVGVIGVLGKMLSQSIFISFSAVYSAVAENNLYYGPLFGLRF